MSNVNVLLSLYRLIKPSGKKEKRLQGGKPFFLHGNSQMSVALQSLWLTCLLSIPPAGISCLHVHVIRMFHSVLNREEPSVFAALLRLRRFLFLTPRQWHHATFINLFPPLSHWILLWKIPQRLDWNPQWQNKSEVTENSHLRVKESDSLSQQYFSLMGGCAIQRKKLVVKRVTCSRMCPLVAPGAVDCDQWQRDATAAIMSANYTHDIVKSAEH